MRRTEMADRADGNNLPAPVTAEPARRYENPPQSQPLDKRGLALIILGTLLWTANSIAIKFALTGLPPYTLMASRATLATALLLVVVRWQRIPFPSSRAAWGGAIFLGVFQLAVSGTLFFWALQYLPVGRAQILGAVQPFLTVIAAHFLVSGERLHSRTVLGLTLGFVGVVIVTLSRGGELGGDSLAADAAVLGGAAIATFGSILIKRIGYRWRMLALVTAQMATTAVLMLVVAAVFEAGAPKSFTFASLGGLFYLATIGSGVAFFVNYYVVRRYEVGIVSSFVFLQPVFAVVLGALILGEAITWTTVFSLVLVSAGILYMNTSRRVRKVTRG
jgi:drug/metabolite transporter (DMT)-like permease